MKGPRAPSRSGSSRSEAEGSIKRREASLRGRGLHQEAGALAPRPSHQGSTLARRTLRRPRQSGGGGGSHDRTLQCWRVGLLGEGYTDEATLFCEGSEGSIKQCEPALRAGAFRRLHPYTGRFKTSSHFRRIFGSTADPARRTRCPPIGSVRSSAAPRSDGAEVGARRSTQGGRGGGNLADLPPWRQPAPEPRPSGMDGAGCSQRCGRRCEDDRRSATEERDDGGESDQECFGDTASVWSASWRPPDEPATFGPKDGNV